jgi:hypothetical protein
LAINDYLEQKAKHATASKAKFLQPKSSQEVAECNAHFKFLRAAARAAAAGSPLKVTSKDFKEWTVNGMLSLQARTQQSTTVPASCHSLTNNSPPDGPHFALHLPV